MTNKTTHKTIVQICLLDSSGDSHHRMRWPARHLAEQAPEWRVINLDFRAEERLRWGCEADFLAILHCGDVDLFPVIQKRKAQGKKTFIEINDNFYSPQPWNPVKQRWNSPMVWARYQKLMELSDGVIVSGPGLVNLLSKRISNPKKIHVLENHFPYDIEDFERSWERKPDPHHEIIFGWGGSAGHMADLLSVVPLLRDLLEKFPQLKIHLMGDPSIQSFVKLPEDRVRYFSWGHVDEYLKFWSGIHVGLVPLLESGFNECRSDIKPIEIAGMAAVPVIQKSLPYETFLKQSGSKSFFTTDQDLRELLISYLKDPALMRENAKACHSYVGEKRMGKHRRERMELYSQLVAGVDANSDFEWPFEVGFHELTGTISIPSPSQLVLTSAQQLWNSGQFSQALEVLTKGMEENPFQSDFGYAELQFRAKALDSWPIEKFRKRIQEFQESFPEDLRFDLFLIQIEKDLKMRRTAWWALIEKVKGFPTDQMYEFAPQFFNLFAQEINSVGAEITDLVEIGDSLLQIFPEFSELQFKMAEIYEQLGRNAESLSLYRSLLQKKNQLSKSSTSPCLSDTPDYVFQVWVGALEARVTGPSGK